MQRLSEYFSTAAERSGSSALTVSPKAPLARRPGSPDSVTIGIRSRMELKTANSSGRSTTGSARGRNPREVEAMKGGKVVSSGLVSARTLKEGTGSLLEPIVINEEDVI